jgi:hypothetical protein
MALSPACTCVSCPAHRAAAPAACVPAGPQGLFAAARERFESVVAGLAGPGAGALSHGELEERLGDDARELARLLLQAHLDLRAAAEGRARAVTGADQVTRRRAETGHRRGLATVFGPVTVTRIAYRAPGHRNLYPADAALNLPAGRHSHGLRRLAAIEASRGSFAEAAEAIRRASGTPIGKRQVQQLAAAAAADVDAFYATGRLSPPAGPATDVLVLSADGTGVIMRPGSLRPRARRAAAKARAKLATRLTRGEVRHRKRMAEVGTVYDITPVPRTPADILTTGNHPPPGTARGPTARGKWVTASIQAPTAQVIAAVFGQAERRDPHHTRTWIALADGNPSQIRYLTAEATRRHLHLTIVIDLIHVLEHLWKAAWCLHAEADPAAETWVTTHARQILAGHAHQAAAAIRAAAATPGLSATKRKTAHQTADYLTRKAPYLNYPAALAAGWPIATGVIEGACRHLVKDRMNITGARWSTPGAETILKLRAVITNGDLPTYWTYHLTREHQRTHPQPRTSYQLAA